MTSTDFLHHQTKDAYNWINKLLNSIPSEKWDVTPETVETNVTWQAGHLTMSFYFHSIMVIAGHQPDIIQKIPLRDYSELFSFNESPKSSIGKTNANELFGHLKIVQEKSLSIIQSLSPTDLESNLESTKVKHPVAKTKLEALDWNIKHTMWHCGQLGILKRIIDKRYDFGLRKPE